MISRFAHLAPFAVIACGSLALAQDPPPAPAVPQAAAPADKTATPRLIDPYMPSRLASATAPEPYVSPRRPRTRTAPDPHDPASRGGGYEDDSSYGFRNPGGRGRMAEYYPPGNNFESGGKDPIGVAKFGSGPGAPDRNEQLQAQQVGIQKQNEFDNRINSLARPLGGFGAGFGFGYGFGGFPF